VRREVSVRQLHRCKHTWELRQFVRSLEVLLHDDVDNCTLLVYFHNYNSCEYCVWIPSFGLKHVCEGVVFAAR
jgi:hypothetical protein